jgi:hypothetical protein
VLQFEIGDLVFEGLKCGAGLAEFGPGSDKAGDGGDVMEVFQHLLE